MKITKVFTKYDKPHGEIIVPVIGEIKATPLNDDTDMNITGCLPITERHLRSTKKVGGLEGVQFITYSD